MRVAATAAGFRIGSGGCAPATAVILGILRFAMGGMHRPFSLTGVDGS